MTNSMKSFTGGFLAGFYAFAMPFSKGERRDANNAIAHYWLNTGKYIQTGIDKYAKQ